MLKDTIVTISHTVGNTVDARETVTLLITNVNDDGIRGLDEDINLRTINNEDIVDTKTLHGDDDEHFRSIIDHTHAMHIISDTAEHLASAINQVQEVHTMFDSQPEILAMIVCELYKSISPETEQDSIAIVPVNMDTTDRQSFEAQVQILLAPLSAGKVHSGNIM